MSASSRISYASGLTLRSSEVSQPTVEDLHEYFVSLVEVPSTLSH